MHDVSVPAALIAGLISFLSPSLQAVDFRIGRHDARSQRDIPAR